jgi:hypothetical protein
MSNPDQLDIKQVGEGRWVLTFPYREDFIELIKTRVPRTDRSYDEVTHEWTIVGDQYIPALEGVGVQKFSFATRIFLRDGKRVWRNLKTGKEEIQENLPF